MSVWKSRTFARPEVRWKSRSGAFYKLWRSWCDEITVSGKWLIAALLIAGLGTVTVELPIYQIFCGLAVVLVVSIFAGFLFFPVVKVETELPDRTATGLSVTGKVTVKNTSWFRPGYDLNIGLFDMPAGLSETTRTDTIKQLRVGESTEVALSIHAHRRGLFALPPLRAYTSFPFNLFRLGRPIQSMESLLVVPSFHPLVSVDVPLGAKYQPGGISLTSHLGESAEYIGNREYIPGESTRRMDFRSWARLGKPVVREFQEEYYCRIALVLDTWIPNAKATDASRIPREGVAQLEAGISLAAAVADSLSSGEYLVDLFAAGSELYVFKADSHTPHFENILEILACVEPSEADPFDTMAPSVTEELQSISTAICILLGWDDGRRALMQSIREAGCSLKLIIVSDEQPTGIGDDFDFVVLSPSQIQAGVVESI